MASYYEQCYTYHLPDPPPLYSHPTSLMSLPHAGYDELSQHAQASSLGHPQVLEYQELQNHRPLRVMECQPSCSGPRVEFDTC